MTTLYDDIGGKDSIKLLVTAFYQRVLSDALLLPFFENTPVEKLSSMQVAFFAIALGGPPPKVEISLFEAHRDRGIKVEHLTRFTDHLMETLKEVGIREQDAQRVYQRIATYADDILGESSVDG